MNEVQTTSKQGFSRARPLKTTSLVRLGCQRDKVNNRHG